MTRQRPIRSWRLHGRMTSCGAMAAAGAAARPTSTSAGRTRDAIHRLTSASGLGQELGAHEDLAGLGALPGADDPVLLHHVDEAGGLRIAQAHAALQERDGRL